MEERGTNTGDDQPQDWGDLDYLVGQEDPDFGAGAPAEVVIPRELEGEAEGDVPSWMQGPEDVEVDFEEGDEDEEDAGPSVVVEASSELGLVPLGGVVVPSPAASGDGDEVGPSRDSVGLLVRRAPGREEVDKSIAAIALGLMGPPPGSRKGEGLPLTEMNTVGAPLMGGVAHAAESPVRVQKPALPEEQKRISADQLGAILPGEKFVPAVERARRTTTSVVVAVEQPAVDGAVVSGSAEEERTPERREASEFPDVVVASSVGEGQMTVVGEASLLPPVLGGRELEAPSPFPAAPGSPGKGRKRDDGGRPERDTRPAAGSGAVSAGPTTRGLTPLWVAGVGLGAGILGGGVVLALGGLRARNVEVAVPGVGQKTQDQLRAKRAVLDYLDAQKEGLEGQMIVLEGQIEAAAKTKDWPRVLVLEREKQSLVGMVQSLEARKKVLLEGGK